MSRSDAWVWRTVLLIRPPTDTWTRTKGERRGVLLVRDLDNPPAESVDDLGERVPAGWRPGVVSPEPPGLVGALDALLGPRRGVRVYVVTVTASTVAEWRAQLPSIAARVELARQDWPAPELVIVGRETSVTLARDVAELAPRVAFVGPLTSERPVVDGLLPAARTRSTVQAEVTRERR